MPQAAIREATASLLAVVAGARNPLAAELAVSAALGAVAASLPGDTQEQERTEALTFMLGEVIAEAETIASAEALALLRVCSVLGPATSRIAAQHSAERLAAAGVADRPWSGRVGRPTMLRAWHYGDVFGEQSSIGMLFDYQGREHAVLVLVDHRLSGGVKDCWLADGRRASAARDSFASVAAGEPWTFLDDIDAVTAVEHLDAALRRPSCPEQPDQVRDVNEYLYLVRARVEHLGRLAGMPAISHG